MPINERYQKQLFRLFDALLLNVGFYDLYSNATHLLFLKFLISYGDMLPNLSIESYKALINFKRKYDGAKTNSFVLNSADIRELFNQLDKDFAFGSMRLNDSFWTYDAILRDKVNQAAILCALDGVDFESEKDFIGDFFELLVQECSRDAKMTGESVTSKALRELAAKLLTVTNQDVFLNCFSGFSSITLNIKNFKKYIGFELNHNTFAVAQMLLIMRGIDNAEIVNDDFLTSETKECADKVFSDGPINMKYDVASAKYDFGVNTKDVDLLILYKVLESIKPGGTAVITVPGKVLFSQNSSYKEMRNRFVDEGLKAVVSLPALWSNTSILTNILVIKKGYQGRIEFINASNCGKRIKNGLVTILSEEEINRIVSAVNNETDENGFSSPVERSVVKNNNDWSPGQYIKIELNNPHRNINDINAELFGLYEEIKRNL